MANAGGYDDRTITQFRTKLAGGGARANLFEVELVFPTGVVGVSTDTATDTTNDVQKFMVKGAELPGSTVSAISVPFRGRQLKVSGDRTFAPWTITVINDTDFAIRNSFEQWMNYMNRNEDNAGVITPSVYQTELYVYQLGRGTVNTTLDQGSSKTTDDIPIYKTYKFYGAFPTDITPIALSYDSVDTIEEFSVTFEYQWWDTYMGGAKNATSMLAPKI